MKKNFQKKNFQKKNFHEISYILLAAGMLTLGGCGSTTTTPAEDAADVQTAEVTAEAADEVETGDADASEDASVNADADASVETNVVVSVPAPLYTVTYETITDETKADDGTVVLESSVTIPTVNGGTDATVIDKINEDMKQYLESTPTDSQNIEWALENYEGSLDDDGMAFFPYSDDIYVEAKRLDENVISFEITYYSYSGGAHGNYGSEGRNYNAKTGELISYDELSPDPDSFRKQSGEYLADLAETETYNALLFPNTSRDDVKEVLFVDDQWLLTESGITYISDPYALAPYAGGTIYFTMPYADAADAGLDPAFSYPGNYVQKRLYTASYDLEGNNITETADPEYSFDLNGDGNEEEISFYGYVYGEDASKISLLIDGVEFGDVIGEQLDLSSGYLDSDYLLYDLNPADAYVEIGVLFASIGETDPAYQTYFFRYTKSGELIYLGATDGYADDPSVNFESAWRTADAAASASSAE